MKQKSEPFSARQHSSGFRDGIPKAAELLPDIFILLNLRHATREDIVLTLWKAFKRKAPGQANGTDSRMFRSKVEAAINYLQRSGLIDPPGKKVPVYITEEGYGFLHELTPAKIQALLSNIEPKPRGMPTSRWVAPLLNHQALQSLSEQIEHARRSAPRRPTPDERAATQAAKLALSLPDMPLDKIFTLWTNANESLSHPKHRLAAR